MDAPRGETFVELQHQEGGDWVTIETEDGPEDTTVLDETTGEWTETWPDAEGSAFEADVRNGSTISSVSVTDGCGNSTP